MDDRIFICDLIDAYGELIKPSRLMYLKQYYFENMTLAEIGEIYGVTRQSVYAQISKIVKQLKSFEKKLKNVEKNKKLSSLLKALKNEGPKLIFASEAATRLEEAMEG